MCWIPTNKEHIAVAKVAQKDIPIVKIGYNFQKDKFLSFVRGCIYNLQYPTPKIKIKPYNARVRGTIEYSISSIHEGYHFYKTNMIKIVLSKHSTSFVDVCGIFDKKTICRFFIDKFKTDVCIAKGYVPKGTIYYLNARGEGVAEQIVITEITCIKDYLNN